MSTKKQVTRTKKVDAKPVEAPVEAPVVEAKSGPALLVSAARVRTNIDKQGLNHKVNTEIAAQKALLDPAYVLAKSVCESKKISTLVKVKDAVPQRIVDGKTVAAEPESFETQSREATPEELTTYAATVAAGASAARPIEQKIDALHTQKYRISQNTPVVLSIVLETMVRELVLHTMKYAHAHDRKIIFCEHLHEADPKTLSLYPLYANSPSFIKKSGRVAAAAAEREAAETRKQIERELRKANKLTPRDKKTKEEEPVQQPKVEEEEELESEHDFKFYVGQVCKDQILEHADLKSIRVSLKLKEHVSNIMIETLDRFCTLLPQVTEALKNKTISDTAVFYALKMLLTDGHACDESLELVPTMVPEPERLAAELKKASDDKTYKFDIKALPQVSSFKATRTVTYPTSAYSKLHSAIQAKLDELNAASPKKAAQDDLE